jgi:hypothetical protein
VCFPAKRIPVRVKNLKPDSDQSERKSSRPAHSAESPPTWSPIRVDFLPQLSIAGLAAGGVKRRIGACQKASFRPGTA